jgi:ribonuclease P protein component
VGIVVSRKVGNAVVRNRVRRRLRDGVRDLLRQGVSAEACHAGAPSFDLVIIARPSAATVNYAELRSSLERALSRGRLR